MKVPEPRKLKSGKWFIQLRLDHKSISITDSSKKECIRRAALEKAEYLNGKKGILQGSKMTLRSMLEKYCNEKETPLSPETIRGYHVIMRNRFQSVMDKPVDSINNWQQLINQEAQHLSPKTVANSWGLISAALRYFGMPVPETTLPQIVQRDMPWLDAEQTMRFVEACKGHKHEIGMLLALHALRRSEVCNLTWENVDLEHGLVRVRGAMVYDKNGKLVSKPENKNTSSRRTVHIVIPELISALEAVEDKTGRIVNCAPNTLYRAINSVCESAGLPRSGVHGLRRSYASLGHYLKWSDRQLMAEGGWRTAQALHKSYVRLSEREVNESINTMTDFFNANKKC